MTDDHIELTRRKILAASGAIGLAGAGAGMGTTALYTDDEPFENNTLAAGELDLKVDWEEHYWNDFDTSAGVEHVSSADEVGENQVGLPDPTNPMIAVDDLETFMHATGIEAFPDENEDGVQDSLENYDACKDFANTPEGLDPTSSLRSYNSDTYDEESDEYLPLVNLDDVKPGDFGELTLSFHLCDNPGYVWLQGEQVSASENGHTGPESEVDSDSEVELLDEIQTLLWYDEDGDNVFEPGGETDGKVDVVLVLDRSGSMSGTKNQEMRQAARNLVDALNLGSDAAQVGVVSFANQEEMEHPLSTDGSSVKSAIDTVGASGGTNIEGGVNGGEEELRGSESGTDFSAQVTASGNDRTDADKVMVVLSDGAANEDDDGAGDYSADGSSDPTDEASRAKGNGVEMYTIALGSSASTSTLSDMASDPTSDHFYQGGAGDLTQIFGNISQQIEGEDAFFRGTLRDLIGQVSSGDGIPLDGDRSTDFDELSDGDSHDNRDPYVNSTNNFVGLAWWVPRSVGNSIQGDSVSFDLGFYTEQARHNDGSGPS